MTNGQDETMALADMIVVMNNDKIAQTGLPRDVYNAHKSEFVARSIGGHNVLMSGTKSIAVRLDLNPAKAAKTVWHRCWEGRLTYAHPCCKPQHHAGDDG